MPPSPIAPQLFYEMLSFQKPFHWCTPDVFMREVCHEGRRCKIPKNAPTQISDLLQSCWSQSPATRPEFRDIVPVLEDAYAAAVAAAQKPSRPASTRPHSSSHNAGPSPVTSASDTAMREVGNAPASPRRPASTSGQRGTKKPGLMARIFC